MGSVDNVVQNISHIRRSECDEYFAQYCQSHITLLWISIMLCREQRYSICMYLSVEFSHASLYLYVMNNERHNSCKLVTILQQQALQPQGMQDRITNLLLNSSQESQRRNNNNNNPQSCKPNILQRALYSNTK